MTSGLLISTAQFQKLPVDVRTLLLETVFENVQPPPASQAVVLQPTRAETLMDDDHFAELSPGQARQLVAGCSAKTKKALEIMASSTSRNFHLADVAKALASKPSELSGVWSGLTRRLRGITGDGGAYLIDWAKNDPIDDADGNYADQIGELTEMTYASLRKAFGL